MTRLETLARCLAVALAGAAHAQTILHVDDDAPDAGDGTTWQTAFNDLQDAIDAIDAINNPGVYEIRIAGGTYRPDRGTGDRLSTFEIDNDLLQSAVTLRLEGGFAGLARLAAPNEQDPARYRSVLDGDLNGDDTAGFGNRDDNSRTVLRLHSVNGGSIQLDGVTVRGADGRAAGEIYGRMWISRCTFEDNSAGKALIAGSFTFVLNCAFRFNTDAVAISAGRNTDIANSAMVGNRVGVEADESGVLIINCLIYANTDRGLAENARANVLSSILWANGDGSYQDQVGEFFPSHSIIQGYQDQFGGNTGDDPQFADELGPDGVPLSGDENFVPLYHSPARDAALPSALPNDIPDLDDDLDFSESLPIDLAGTTRVLNRSLDIGPYEICPPDMTGSSAGADPTYGIPDGDTDADDWFFFLDIFSFQDPRADITGSDDPDDPDYGVPDGNIGIDDYFFFLDAFARGC